MNKDEYAGLAMLGMIISGYNIHDMYRTEEVDERGIIRKLTSGAEIANKIADAMMKQREIK